MSYYIHVYMTYACAASILHFLSHFFVFLKKKVDKNVVRLTSNAYTYTLHQKSVYTLYICTCSCRTPTTPRHPRDPNARLLSYINGYSVYIHLI